MLKKTLHLEFRNHLYLLHAHFIAIFTKFINKINPAQLQNVHAIVTAAGRNEANLEECSVLTAYEYDSWWQTVHGGVVSFQTIWDTLREQVNGLNLCLSLLIDWWYAWAKPREVVAETSGRIGSCLCFQPHNLCDFSPEEIFNSICWVPMKFGTDFHHPLEDIISTCLSFLKIFCEKQRFPWNLLWIITSSEDES